MRVLVFGGTRGVGRSFVEQAARAGHDITLFARDAGAIEAWPVQPARVVKGDARDRSSVESAIPGHDAVVMSLGPSGAERFQRFIGPATSWMVGAMGAAGVRRLLFVSALGVGESRVDAPPSFRWFVVPILLRTTFADRTDAEAVVKASPLAWTIVRPLYLTDEPAVGRWTATTDMRAVREGIAREDVASFLLHELARGEHVREAVALGPQPYAARSPTRPQTR